MQENVVQFESTRRFGVEIELNSFDNRDFKAVPLKRGEKPEGIEAIALLINSVANEEVEIKRYHPTNDNMIWVVKTDSSCGIEVCSPITKGNYGIDKICKVIKDFKKDSRVQADERCSFHIHFDISDCTITEVASILLFWVKSEHLFIDSVPIDRKKNRYCQPVCFSNLFTTNSSMEIVNILNNLGKSKYYSINAYHYFSSLMTTSSITKSEKKTIEFRLMGNEGCVNPIVAGRWIKLLAYFLEVARNIVVVEEGYVRNQNPSNYSWYDLDEFMQQMKFYDNLSEEMIKIRNWFLARMYVNIGREDKPFLWCGPMREKARKDLDEVINKLGLKNVEKYLK